jgi:hypothetical protein
MKTRPCARFEREDGMKLPAETMAADAVKFARAFLERHSGNPWSDYHNASAEAGRAFWRQLLQRAARQHPVYRLRIIAMARAGDRDADHVLRTMMIEMQSTVLPAELRRRGQHLSPDGVIRPAPTRRRARPGAAQEAAL